MKVATNLFMAVLLVIGFSSGVFAQHNHMNKEEGKILSPFEMAQESFHEVMASTFHPAQDGDLMPLKERSGDLVAASKEWKNIVLPEGFPVENLRPLLKKLYKDSKKIDKMVEKGATDEELKAAIFALHDVFHGIRNCDEQEPM